MDETQRDQNNLQELLFEHEQLRKEILQNETIALQIMGATAVLVTAILGAVFSQANQEIIGEGFLVYVATFVTLFGLNQIIYRWRSIFRTASYLRTFDESRLKLVRWETRLLRLRVLAPHDEGYGLASGYQLVTFAFLAVVTYVLGTIYIWQDVQAFPQLVAYLAGPIVMFPFTLWNLYDIWRTHRKCVLKHAETFDPLWNRIKVEEANAAKQELPSHITQAQDDKRA